MVKVFIPKIAGQREQPDVIIGINGKDIQIKRGVEVEVPEAYAKLLKFKQKMREVADEHKYASASN